MMASGRQPLALVANGIKDWQKEIDYTFGQLLKQHHKSDTEFQYFCRKCQELGLCVTTISLDHLKLLLTIVKDREDGVYLEIIDYIFFSDCEEKKLRVTIAELQTFVQWLLLENSIRLLEYLSDHEPKLKKMLSVDNQQSQFSLSQCLA
jgi:hypothetical protein